MNTKHAWKLRSKSFLKLVVSYCCQVVSICSFSNFLIEENKCKCFTLTFLFLHFDDTQWFYEDLQDLLELTPPKDVIFNIGDWNMKVGSQEIPEVTGKFGLGVQNEAGQRLIEHWS